MDELIRFWPGGIGVFVSIRGGQEWFPPRVGRSSISCKVIFLISTRLQPGESCAEKTETVSTVFRARSHQAVETAWRRIASTHRAEARC